MSSPEVLLTQRGAAYAARDDEIDLFQLLQDLWHHKWLILAFVVAAGAVTVAYLLLTTSTYRVQSNIETVSPQSLVRVTIPGVDYSVSPASAFSGVTQNLSSWRVRKDFFEANRKLFQPILADHVGTGMTPEQVFEGFDRKNFVFHAAQAKGVNRTAGDKATYIRLTYPANMDGVAITNGLMHYAIVKTKRDILQDLGDALAHQLEKLRYDISSQRVAFVGDILHESTSLKRSLDTARQLGIKKPTRPYEMAGGQAEVSLPDSRADQEIVRAEVNSQHIPRYFLGTDVLGAELVSLRGELGKNPTVASLKLTTASDTIFQDRPMDEFIKGLYRLKRQGRYLDRVEAKLASMSLADIKLVNITREATAPARAIRPRKELVLMLGLILGGLIGAFVALIRSAWKKRSMGNGGVSA